MGIYAILAGYYAIYVPDFREILLNTIIISLQMAFVWLYFKIFRPNEKGFIDKKLGLGDVLLLYALAFIFSPVALVIFILMVCILSLLISLAIYFLKRLPTPLTIPFAGNLSFAIAVVFIIESYTGFALRKLTFLNSCKYCPTHEIP
jgi:hypothetical protein